MVSRFNLVVDIISIFELANNSVNKHFLITESVTGVVAETILRLKTTSLTDRAIGTYVDTKINSYARLVLMSVNYRNLVLEHIDIVVNGCG